MELEIVKVEYVKMKEDLSTVPYGKVIVEVYNEYDECDTTRVEVVEEAYLTRYIEAIDKEALGKRIVSYAWHVRGKEFKTAKIRINPITLEIEMHIRDSKYAGYDYVYPQLRLDLFTIVFNEETFSRYATREEAEAKYYALLNDYTECTLLCLDKLYETTITDIIKNEVHLKVRDYNGENELTVSVISKENILERFYSLNQEDVARGLYKAYEDNLEKDGLYVAVLSTVVANVVEFRYYEPGVMPKYPNLQIVLSYIDTLEEKEMIGNDLEGKVVVETNCDDYVYEQIDKLYGSN